MPAYESDTLYERGHPQRSEQSFGIALGQIFEVFPEERMCSVTTFQGQTPDQFLAKVQWLSLDANVDGDESGSIPRAQSLCLVFTVDGVSYVWGFFKPLTDKGSALLGNEYAELIEGDKIFSTAAGNRLVIKSNGTIELFGKDSLRRLMFPDGSFLSELCRRYELKTDGGVLEWGADEDVGLALYRAEYKQTIVRAIVVLEEKGAVSDTIVERKTIGTTTPGSKDIADPLYKYEFDLVTGISAEVKLPGPLPGVAWTVDPLGSWGITSGPKDNFDLQVSALGDIEIKNLAFSAVISNLGEVTIKNKVATISVSASGEVTIDTKGKAKLSAASLDIMTLGPLNVDAKGPVSIKSGATIELAGGPGGVASDFVLTSPTTIDPFTGAPFATFSKTVKASP
jgi:hypothetical protein